MPEGGPGGPKSNPGHRAPCAQIRRHRIGAFRPSRFHLAIAVLLLLAACDRGGARNEADLETPGSSVHVTARGASAATLDAALAQARRELVAREADWHAWHPSTLTRLNAALRRGEPAPATPTLLRLLDRSYDFAQASDGLLDPAVGGLVELWGFHTDRFPLASPAPAKAAIDAWLAARPRLQQVHVEGDRLVSSNRGVQLDFNAILEGETAVALETLLASHGLRDVRLDQGGDTVVLGDDGGRPWEVAFRDPYGGDLGQVALRDGEAFFTSGNYDKFRASTNGGRWGHILDPRTGMPARGAAATAVLSDDPVLADAASTALMVGGPSTFARLVQQLHVGCALMVTEENELLITTAMQARIDFARDPIPLGAPVDAGKDCRAPSGPPAGDGSSMPIAVASGPLPTRRGFPRD
jgi:thiamine biosynthesis lipoprotein